MDNQQELQQDPTWKQLLEGALQAKDVEMDRPQRVEVLVINSGSVLLRVLDGSGDVSSEVVDI